MKTIISSLALNISKDDISSGQEPNLKSTFIVLIISSIAWSYILIEMTNAYINKEGFGLNILSGIIAFLYSFGFVLMISLFSGIFLMKYIGFKKGFIFSVLATLPVAAISIISLVFKLQFGLVKVLGYFPEHALIMGAYLTIFSEVRLVSNCGKNLALVHLVFLTVLVYILIGPIMFKLFNL
ncbi:MAG: hypothetical protein EHM58_05210 [Ignavibacteriae bacterium]|nr:MAG: hypothetical protein EHM58_05210 [Ignavibacteriota bacterium]